MATLGYFILLSTFVVCSYAAGVSVAGARRGSRKLVESGIGAFHLVTALMTVASVLIVQAFVTDDFSIKYVSRYSESFQPLFFKITSYWGGLDGSIMFWVFLLACFGSIAVHVNRDRHRELIPYVVAVIAGVQMFFLFLMIIHNNPFNTFLTQVPPDGNGLNPLLQNVYMVIHPPSLYIGFVGMTIPFAFGMAALITGHLDDAWLRAVRRWTMFAWIFLSFGLTLGMIWAYEELGWGGFWGWDPVENAGLLPWFTATAFLHSVMVQERRSMLRVWNVTLVILTFFLTIFAHVHDALRRRAVGALVRRESRARHDVQHLHGRDSGLQLRPRDLSAAAAALEQRARLVGVARSRVPGQQLDSAVLCVLRAVRDDVPDAQRSDHGRAHHDRSAVLQPLDGADRPHAAGADGHRTAARVAEDVALEPALSVPVADDRGRCHCRGGAWRSASEYGHRVSASCSPGSCSGTIWQEFWRGAVIRRRSTGTDLFTATIGLVGRSRRRYGGYIVHVGIVLMCLGFAGQGFKLTEQVLLKPGQQTTIGDYTIRMDALRVTQDNTKQMVTGHFTVFDGGSEIAKMYPGSLVLQQTRRADHRSGDPPDACAKICTSTCRRIR